MGNELGSPEQCSADNKLRCLPNQTYNGHAEVVRLQYGSRIPTLPERLSGRNGRTQRLPRPGIRRGGFGHWQDIPPERALSQDPREPAIAIPVGGIQRDQYAEDGGV